MNAAQRRERILTRLNSAGAPLSASTLAAELGVSRQIVVGDVALLRAGGAQIDATPRGYQLHPAEKGYTGILACVHRTQEEMRRELYTVVDQGGTVVDVAVENSLYGEIRATLNLCNRYDVDNFIRQAADAPESLLSRMTGGVHLHTLRCPDKDTFARIRDALEQQGLLYRKEYRRSAYTQYKKGCGACLSAKTEKCWKINKNAKEVGFLDIRIEKTERAIKEAFMELRREKPVEKIRVKELCDRACINKSTFYAHYQDIYALANAMEDEMVHAVVESLPRLTANDVSERTEWLTREMFRAFTAHQAEISVLFSGSRQGLFINRVEQAMCQCIAQTDPTFEADVVRKVVLSFCVQGCYYTFTGYCGQMDEKRLVTLLASIARAAQRIRM